MNDAPTAAQALSLESLHPLFHPRSIAVVGASGDAVKIGGRTFRYLKDNGYSGALYPVNAKSAEVQGVPALSSVAELPAGVDLAFVIVPAPHVIPTLEGLAARGCRTAVIFSSGFAEVDDAGREAQARLVEIAKGSGMRIVGPNCMGVMNVRMGVLGTFTGSFDYGGPPWPGGVGIVSQSGAFGSHCFAVSRAKGLGLSLWLTTGNEADVDLADGLAYLAQDDDTEVIMAYMEGARSRDKLIAALELCHERRKPVVVLKVGQSEIGALAASSHTASLVGSDAVYDAVFRQHGVHRAKTIEELVDIAYACTARRYPTGRRIGLVTVSGGVGVLMADGAERHRLDVPPLPEPAQRKLKELLPFAAVRNPVDTTAQMLNDVTLINRNLEVMLAEGGCDAVAVFLTSVGLNTSMTERLHEPLRELSRNFPNPPLVLSTLYTPELKRDLEEMGYLLYEDPTRAVEAVAALAGFAESFARQRPRTSAIDLSGMPAVPAEPLDEHAAKRLLAEAGLPVVDERLATSADEAAAAAEALGGPVAMKVASPDIQHKSEIGGVMLGVAGAEAAAKAYRTLEGRAREASPNARLEGVLVAPMIADGVETILGVNRDPVFGPVVLFGLGGIFVEVLKDVTFRIAPFDEAEAHAMIREVRGFPLLDGARGRPKADLDALATALATLSRFAAANAERLESLDVNPLLVRPQGKGAVAVDALIVPRKA